MDRQLSQALIAHGVRQPEPLAETAAARLFLVRKRTATRVLKLYRRGHPGNEAAGLTYMQAARSPGMVRILATAPDSVLMEHLDGPSLGELSREGRDEEAGDHLARIARILSGTRPALPDLPRLEDWIARLLALTCAPGCPARLRRDIDAARALARRLFDNAPPPVALHGDLHHDNVILTSDGPRAFDAKGLSGDPAFELANALRRPRGVPDLLRNPARITRDLEHYARTIDVPQDRLAGWAAVKCAHSIALTTDGALEDHPEADLLSLLLTMVPAR